MKQTFLIIQIFFCFIIYGQNNLPCQNFCDKLTWDIKSDVVYSLKITETNIDTFPAIFNKLNPPKNAKQTKANIFPYPNCEIILNAINKDTFQMRLISNDYKFSNNKTNGILLKTKFSREKDIHSTNYVRGDGDYGIFYKLLIESIYNFDPEIKRIRYGNSLDFDSYFPFRLSTSIVGYMTDSTGHSIPDNSLKLISIDTSNNDTIAKFNGNFGLFEEGNLFQKVENNDTTVLRIYFNINLDYSVKDKQVTEIGCEIFVFSQGTINSKKKILIALKRN